MSRSLTCAPLLAAQSVRYGAATLFLWALARVCHVPLLRPRGREWLWLMGVATTGLVLFNVAVVRGAPTRSRPWWRWPWPACPWSSLQPGPFGKVRHLLGRVLMAAIVVTAGAVLIAGVGRTDALGVVWAVVTLACEASFTLLAVPVLPRHGPWGVSVHSVWMATAMFAGLSLLGEGPAAVSRLSATDWAAVGYLAVMVTAVAFLLWYSAVASLGPGGAGLLTGIAPASAAGTGILVGSQAPEPLVWVGMLIVALGLGIGLFSHGSRPHQETNWLPRAALGRCRQPRKQRTTEHRRPITTNMRAVFAYDGSLTDRYPTIRAGIVHALGLNNGPSPARLLEEYGAEQQKGIPAARRGGDSGRTLKLSPGDGCSRSSALDQPNIAMRPKLS